MPRATSQQTILKQLKQHGGQSVKVLARSLEMTTMGLRQHLAELQSQGLVEPGIEARQTRGRPLHLWELTAAGHREFPDAHRQISVELLDAIRDEFGESGVEQIVARRSRPIEQRYARALNGDGELADRLQSLARLRTVDGYMAEVRLLPDQNWLFIENHCPVCAAAENCPRICDAELQLFQKLLGSQADIQRADHLLAGDRRCAYTVKRRTFQ